MSCAPAQRLVAVIGGLSLIFTLLAGCTTGDARSPESTATPANGTVAWGSPVGSSPVGSSSVGSSPVAAASPAPAA